MLWFWMSLFVLSEITLHFVAIDPQVRGLVRLIFLSVMSISLAVLLISDTPRKRLGREEASLPSGE